MKIRYFLLLVFFSTVLSCTSTVEETGSTRENNELLEEYISLSDEYIELKMYAEALELLQKAELYEGNNPSLTFKIARTAALSENWNLSLDYYNIFLTTDPNNLLIQKSIAWIYGQSGDFTSSVKLYKELYENHSYDKEICTNYILMLLATNKKDDAKIVFENYAKLYPDESNLLDLQQKVNSETITEEKTTEVGSEESIDSAINNENLES